MGSFRQYVKRRTGPISQSVARKWKQRLSVAYGLIAWNLFGLTVYYVLKQNYPKTQNNTQEYAKILGIKNATVMKYSGFEKVDEYKLQLTQEEINDHVKPSKGK